MSKVNFVVKDGKLQLGVDSNEDGQNVVSLNLNLTEAIQEAVARGQAVDGVRLVDFKFDSSKLILKVDSDKDGEPLLDIELDLGEAFDEIQSAANKEAAPSEAVTPAEEVGPPVAPS